MPPNPRLADYVTVAERLTAFYAKFPEGSIQAYIIVDDGKRIVMRAHAYRYAGDPYPGIGHAEEVRGSSPVNKLSALENAETSAWGRAMAALGFEVKHSIASREEAQNAAQGASRAPRRPAAIVLPDDRVNAIGRSIGEAAVPFDRLCLMFASLDADAPAMNRSDSLRKALRALTPEQADRLEVMIANEEVS